jgi:peptidoglycan/xylan/chitin deacetylase (PgdA/CDA1 family)
MMSAPELLKRGKRAVKHALLRAFGAIRKLDRCDANAVLLTFDDGPHPEVTEGVLERLQRYGARAVFFVVGDRIPRATWVVPQIAAAGHLIGNHSFSHPLYRDPCLPSYVSDLKKCQKVVEELTGRRPRLFRPPEGRLNVATLMSPKLLGLRTVFWSVDSDDWRLRKRDDALESGERLSQSVGPGDIVLFHDDNPYVLPLLDVLLPALAARGCDLHSAAECLK